MRFGCAPIAFALAVLVGCQAGPASFCMKRTETTTPAGEKTVVMAPDSEGITLFCSTLISYVTQEGYVLVATILSEGFKKGMAYLSEGAGKSIGSIGTVADNLTTRTGGH